MARTTARPTEAHAFLPWLAALHRCDRCGRNAAAHQARWYAHVSYAADGTDLGTTTGLTLAEALAGALYDAYEQGGQGLVYLADADGEVNYGVDPVAMYDGRYDREALAKAAATARQRIDRIYTQGDPRTLAQGTAA